MFPLIKHYKQTASKAHRQKFGQYFTPPGIAAFMLEWVLSSGKREIYDPAFGLGAFYQPLSEIQDIIFTTSELDPTIIDFWEKSEDKQAAFVIIEDYLLSWGKKRKNIVCNPPYMRFQKFIKRDQVATAFKHELGVRLSGYTNTASAFLLKSMTEVEGRLAYIMPLESLNTGYGTSNSRSPSKCAKLRG